MIAYEVIYIYILLQYVINKLHTLLYITHIQRRWCPIFKNSVNLTVQRVKR